MQGPFGCLSCSLRAQGTAPPVRGFPCPPSLPDLQELFCVPMGLCQGLANPWPTAGVARVLGDPDQPISAPADGSPRKDGSCFSLYLGVLRAPGRRWPRGMFGWRASQGCCRRSQTLGDFPSRVHSCPEVTEPVGPPASSFWASLRFQMWACRGLHWALQLCQWPQVTWGLPSTQMAQGCLLEPGTWGLGGTRGRG